MKSLIIYHNNCADGFTSAWIAKHFLPEAELHGASYGEAPPDVEGADVLIVDFSYPAEQLLKMADKAHQVIVLDHHKSAALDLAGVQHPKLAVIFDMERSGAGITWDWFEKHERPALFQASHIIAGQRPALVDYVQDRDLWLFKMLMSREASAFIFSHEYTLENWDKLFHIFEKAESRQTALYSGQAIERKHFKDINELINANKGSMVIGGQAVPTLNCPYFYSSDAGHIMALDAPFAACYSDSATHRIFSLRSGSKGMDVSLVAGLYGGGGHKNAAGFRMPLGWAGDKPAEA